MRNSDLRVEKSLTNYFLIRLFISFLFIYLLRTPYFEFLGLFGVLLLIVAIIFNVFLAIAIVSEGLRTQKYYEKFVALLSLVLYGQFYFKNFFSVMWKDFFSFHFATIGSLFIIIPTISILKGILHLLSRKKNNHNNFHLENYLRLPYIVGISIWLIFGHSTFLRIKDGFTNPEVIAKRIYQESSSSYRIGAYCNDGTKSFSTSSGACSWHGGVDDWIYETKYYKSKEKCLLEAKEISWLD